VNETITLSTRYLSQPTLAHLRDCASGNSTGHDAVLEEDGSLLYSLPKDATPHLPGDLAACVMRAIEMDAGKIRFSGSEAPLGDLATYPAE